MTSPLLNLYATLPLKIKEARKNTLITTDGVRYLDTFSGIAVHALGHQHPSVMNALRAQSEAYLHLSNYFETDAQKELARLLIKNSNADKVFFTNSGTEANEAAIKLVRKWGASVHHGKTNIVTVEGAFHGRSTGAMALSGSDTSHHVFEPLMPGVTRVALNDIEALTRAITRDTCAIFLELLYGSSGLYSLNQAFLEAVVRLTKMHNVLVVVDEIQTGLYRTGTFFAYQSTPIVPDVITVAKALGGGLPLGAMLVSETVSSVLKPGDHGTTFGGNPLAASLGVAVLTELNSDAFIQTMHESMTYLMEELLSLHKRYPHIIKEVRGKGFMLGLEVGHFASTIQQAAFESQVLLNVTATSVIRVLPSLIFTPSETNHLVHVLKTIIHKL